MGDKDTVFPYDDEVVDPYSADDTKNPHEPSGGEEADAETSDEDETSDETPKRRPGRPKKNTAT